MPLNAILTFLFANRKQVAKVANKRYRRKIFKSVAFAAVPMAGLYLFAPTTFTSVVDFGKNNIGHVLGISTTTNPQVDNNKFNNPKAVGEKILLGNIQWTIFEAKNIENDTYSSINADYCIPESGNKFIYVRYKIDNLDRDLLTIPKFSLNIYDSEKKEYSYSPKTFMCILQITNPVNKYAPDLLKRGESKTYEILFEVPKDKNNFKLKVGDLSVTSNDYEYVKLGV